MSASSRIRALIIDMDGVLWRGSQPLPGLLDFFAFLRAHQLPFVLASNNAAASAASVQGKLRAMGVEIQAQEALTSAEATALWLQEHLPAGSQVLAIGEASLRNELEKAGFALWERADQVSAVVVGIDRELTWARLAEAALAIQAGARFVGTNPDTSFPSERGLVPGNGALLAALQATTGVEPTVIGKPEVPMFLLALKRLGTPPHETLVIGDRLETDILGGQRTGARTALVLSGVTSKEASQAATIQPDWIVDDLSACVDLLKALLP